MQFKSSTITELELFITYSYYEYNSSLQLIATPNEGYRFIGWFIKEKLVSSEELYVYKVNGDAQLEARFETLSNDPDPPEDPNNPDTPDDPNDPNNPTAIEDVETLVIKVS